MPVWAGVHRFNGNGEMTGTHWIADGGYFTGPAIAETYVGVLSDINARAVTEAHVRDAIAGARGGSVPEGNVGGGTGMICYQFKGGTGTVSRVITIDGKTYIVACLVKANHGMHDGLIIQGVPVGRHLPLEDTAQVDHETGSIIGVIATDLSLAPHQLRRMARRGALGMARGGTIGGNGSGDLFLVFSTANRMPMPARAADIVNSRC